MKTYMKPAAQRLALQTESMLAGSDPKQYDHKYNDGVDGAGTQFSRGWSSDRWSGSDED